MPTSVFPAGAANEYAITIESPSDCDRGIIIPLTLRAGRQAAATMNAGLLGGTQSDINWRPPTMLPPAEMISSLFLVHCGNENMGYDHVLCYYNCGNFVCEFESRNHYPHETIEQPIAWAVIATKE